MPFVFPEYEAAAVVFAHWEYMAPDHEMSPLSKL